MSGLVRYALHDAAPWLPVVPELLERAAQRVAAALDDVVVLELPCDALQALENLVRHELLAFVDRALELLLRAKRLYA
ncbi:hypothetical protein [Mumia zhuanghuii]|uniref:Uncharacterized protein n=1 Tax=Mumia zhuanghuii TaxID=2585211 RepID=A0A5C4MHF7_9ACTN|nr:hypothetical protein [Mumia zhuanghuii]TNC35598.1 hypothetical protein FHE65_26995 [Mumia zhuanghuii]